nr:MAG TPA: GTPase [Caudoviricetes sp.]
MLMIYINEKKEVVISYDRYFKNSIVFYLLW